VRVLFVCTANICRSAFAEVLARHLAPPGLEFDSAGVHGLRAEPMNPPMAAEALARGADPSAFRSKMLTPALVDAADLVLTAEAGHRTRILADQPLALRKAFSFGQFARGLAAVEPGDPETLLQRVRERAATSYPEDDVADPYGRGAAAARKAAAEIEGLLRAVLPALVVTRQET